MRTKNITAGEVERRYAELPREVASVFDSENLVKHIAEIRKANGLAIDVAGRVASEIGYAMLGFVTASEFVSDLVEIIGDRKKAEKVAAEINEKIFAPIRQHLKGMHEEAQTEIPAPPKPAAEEKGAGLKTAPKLPAIIQPAMPAGAETPPAEKGLGMGGRVLPPGPTPSAAAAPAAKPEAEMPDGAEPKPFIINPLPWHRKNDAELESGASGIRLKPALQDRPKPAEPDGPPPGGHSSTLGAKDLEDRAPRADRTAIKSTEAPPESKLPPSPATPASAAPAALSSEKGSAKLPVRFAPKDPTLGFVKSRGDSASETAGRTVPAPQKRPEAETNLTLPKPEDRRKDIFPELLKAKASENRLPPGESRENPKAPAPAAKPQNAQGEEIKTGPGQPRILPEQYRAAKEAFEKDLAAYQNREASGIRLNPASRDRPKPAEPDGPPTGGFSPTFGEAKRLGDKTLETKSEAPRQTENAPRPNAPPQTPAGGMAMSAKQKGELSPLRFAGKKIPKPSAPEHYGADPYKEPIE